MLKKTKQNVSYLEQGKKQITTDLLFAIGCYIDTDGYIINEETSERFQFNGRYLRSVLLGNSINHYGDIELDIFNTKLVSSILDWELKRSSIENGVYYRMYNSEVIDTPSGLRSKLTLSSTEKVYISNSYLNDSYKYIDIIYRLCYSPDSALDHLLQYDLEDYKIRTK